MKLLDSNIFIYAAQPQFAHLRALLANSEYMVSEFTRLEVLGFHRLTIADKQYFERVFNHLTRLPVSEQVLDQAIIFRQSKKMSAGDAIVAASAALFDLDLIHSERNRLFAHRRPPGP